MNIATFLWCNSNKISHLNKYLFSNITHIAQKYYINIKLNKLLIMLLNMLAMLSWSSSPYNVTFWDFQ